MLAMKILKVVLLVVVLGSVGAENPAVAAATTVKSAIPSSLAPEIPGTKSITTTTTSSSNSSSPASSTVPSSNSPSTPASTTSSTTTTTVAPTSAPTTPAPPATTTAKPVPKEFFWNVTDPNGVICILAKADIKLSLTYTSESTKQEVKVDIPVSQNASSSGHCGNTSQILQLTFGNADSLTFNFSENAGKYHLAEILSVVTVQDGNSSVSLSLASGPLELYDTHLNTSYGCTWSEPATLKEDDAQRNTTKASMRLTLRSMRIEAFRNSTDDGFSKEYSCPLDSPDIVPVMVGIALGILVAVVLIAYLVGRRSTQAQGYLSM